MGHILERGCIELIAKTSDKELSFGHKTFFEDSALPLMSNVGEGLEQGEKNNLDEVTCLPQERLM